MMPEIQAITDEVKLKLILRAICTAVSLEDLRCMWTG